MRGIPANMGMRGVRRGRGENTWEQVKRGKPHQTLASLQTQTSLPLIKESEPVDKLLSMQQQRKCFPKTVSQQKRQSSNPPCHQIPFETLLHVSSLCKGHLELNMWLQINMKYSPNSTSPHRDPPNTVDSQGSAIGVQSQSAGTVTMALISCRHCI